MAEWQFNFPKEQYGFSPEALKELEQREEIKLPIEFVNFISKYHGCRPEPNFYKLNYILLCNQSPLKAKNHMLSAKEFLRSQLSKKKNWLNQFNNTKLVPFAHNHSSGYYCLDFTKSPENPTVCLLVYADLEDTDEPIFQFDKPIHFNSFIDWLFLEDQIEVTHSR